ncbi:hypothetical protein NIES4102_27640 [Chondrocystis sp. NIES-4102]|nr:hypothetical protein NIES4102_27640 [Chondrocystis sp. NIES-4102]
MNHNLLNNITAVEISTVIVDEIVDEIFIPWQTYQAIYYLCREYINKSTIHPSLKDHYLQLRRQLELAYCLLLVDPNSKLYNRASVNKVRRDLAILSQNNSDWEVINTRLPEPYSDKRSRQLSQVNQLLKDRCFVNILQQLNKRKISLDRRDRSLHNSCDPQNIIDSTYAQTSLQLDGKIINRYCQAILYRSDREQLLQLHEQSISAGEQQWHGLVKFMLSMIAKQ